MKKVFVDGVFDLFHTGHINFLKQAKALGDYLIVGVSSDSDVFSYKRTPIIPHKQRCEILRQSGIADLVVNDPPLCLNYQFIKKYDIDIVAHGDDNIYSEFYHVPIEMGIMKYLKYTGGVSTSQIIQRIQDHYCTS